jgi:hypothetical protein
VLGQPLPLQSCRSVEIQTTDAFDNNALWTVEVKAARSMGSPIHGWS